MRNNKAIGYLGENIAVRYLKKHGYKIIERNFSIRCGEIDIIAKHAEFLCFVEVKSRHLTFFGEPYEFVTYKKKEKLKRTARMWLCMNQASEAKCRFDVISIIFKKNDKVDKIQHIKNAFM